MNVLTGIDGLGRMDRPGLRAGWNAVEFEIAQVSEIAIEAARPGSVDEVNALFKAAAEGELHGIPGYEVRPLVSIDYVNEPRSSIVDALSTMVIGGTRVKLYAWCDNERGYVNRRIDIARMIAGEL